MWTFKHVQIQILEAQEEIWYVCSMHIIILILNINTIINTIDIYWLLILYIYNNDPLINWDKEMRDLCQTVSYLHKPIGGALKADPKHAQAHCSIQSLPCLNRVSPESRLSTKRSKHSQEGSALQTANWEWQIQPRGCRVIPNCFLLWKCGIMHRYDNVM